MNKLNLVQNWVAAKTREDAAIEDRRAIEDLLAAEFAIPVSGTATFDVDEFSVKVVARINRTVDAAKLQEIAAEHGLSDHLSTLFRWKPEINEAVWKSSASEITTQLLDAITSKPGRPSFRITTKEI